jgi:threonine/homoserine/homoserine lactone efflux protein
MSQGYSLQIEPPAIVHFSGVGPLVLTALAIMGSPGPATISLTAAGSAYGVRRTAGYLIGIIIGTAVVLVAVATGITATLLAAPGLRPVLIAVSAAYLLWLAYHVATAPPLSPQDGAARAPTLRAGTVLGIANPKAWVAIGAVFASAHLSSDATVDAIAKVVVVSPLIVMINGAWLLVGASLAPLLRDPRRARAVNVTLAAALIGATALAIVH